MRMNYGGPPLDDRCACGRVSGRPRTVGRSMDSRKVHGQSEGPWTVGRSMDSRKVYGQSEGLWTVGRSMDSRQNNYYLMPENNQSLFPYEDSHHVEIVHNNLHTIFILFRLTWIKNFLIILTTDINMC
ncbi:CLUMA_CG005518, isoform A [Clunio marinus]|uniref:CLUMA_CG005518, isoform A n=1 Tax=Clunio marinus TaxID=568069 RepID=A0A1J1I0H6_9DIPT|nr:CLUMA_CG005518, isoform A [Clunio marinus]